jgi:hypothetical protein
VGDAGTTVSPGESVLGAQDGDPKVPEAMMRGCFADLVIALPSNQRVAVSAGSLDELVRRDRKSDWDAECGMALYLEGFPFSYCLAGPTL